MYEINARVFLGRMSRKYHQALTLATVPDEEWQLLARRGFNLIWLMGVWQRSPAARQQALLNHSLHREYDKALPGWLDVDVDGSPYAVYSYSLDPSLGCPDGLARLKSNLNRQGLGLVLDFVPNHLALDHPWVFTHPEWFVRGNEAEVQEHCDWFFSPVRNIYLAHGRDPNFPPWSDTVQVNFFSTDLREALISELLKIAEVAEGVRCDMAMLALTDVFEQVWGKYTFYPRPAQEFWAEATARVRQAHPGFLFLAEAYWGLEHKLLQMGFDFVYDKPFYDILRFRTANEIRSYLSGDSLYQESAIRFIENHDEERVISAFGRERSLAAAAILATIPGLRLFHDGQLEGRRIHLPIQLTREPEEPPDSEVLQFYERLLTIVKSPVFREGDWQLLEACPHEGNNRSLPDILAWQWQYGRQHKVVVVNYSAGHASSLLRLPLPSKSSGTVTVRDELTGKSYVQDAEQICRQGLHIELQPWCVEVLSVDYDSAERMTS